MRKILIVDDEASIRITLAAFLRDDGYEADVAEDVPHAQKHLSRTDYDVVVSDIVLPRVSGVSLMQQLQETAPDIPVILMTGEPTVETAVEAVRAGACDYLTKPVNKLSILRAVANAIRIRDLEDDKHRLEIENQRYQANLEELVNQRTQELENAHKKLVRQERLNALAQMASGIAHDFNNVLMPITGWSEMLLADLDILDDREDARGILEAIRTAGNDARHIVRRLRQVYKEEEIDYELLQLVTVVETAISLTTPKWKEEMNAKGRSIEMEMDCGQAPDIKGNATELREALTNLIFNAVDAMPEGGVITFRARCEDATTVVLEVADTGLGMDEKGRQRCMEPFFTTKGTEGTGLGLSMVHGIMQRHGGELEIESQSGVGTIIRMRFPVPSGNDFKIDKPEKELKQLPAMRVLVIDDEARARNLIAKFLKTDGHSVELAGGGQEGLDVFHHDEFDLVITDRAMPAMSGDEVAKEISRAKPGTPIIMLTGFGDIMKDHGKLPTGVNRVMTKPVTLTELRHFMALVISGTS